MSETNTTRLPRHVAIIMDGNGRWAKAHKLAVAQGHRQGTEAGAEISACFRFILRRFSATRATRDACIKMPPFKNNRIVSPVYFRRKAMFSFGGKYVII